MDGRCRARARCTPRRARNRSDASVAISWTALLARKRCTKNYGLVVWSRPGTAVGQCERGRGRQRGASEVEVRNQIRFGSETSRGSGDSVVFSNQGRRQNISESAEINNRQAKMFTGIVEEMGTVLRCERQEAMKLWVPAVSARLHFRPCKLRTDSPLFSPSRTTTLTATAGTAARAWDGSSRFDPTATSCRACTLGAASRLMARALP